MSSSSDAGAADGATTALTRCNHSACELFMWLQPSVRTRIARAERNAKSLQSGAGYPAHRSRVLSYGLILMCGLLFGCERPSEVTNPGLTPTANRPALAPVQPDHVMGGFAPLARHIVAALRDSEVRIGIAASMKSPTAHYLGLDLRLCDTDPLVSKLFASGEYAGAGSATSMCSLVKRYPGVVLYMDPDRLRQWDGRTIPFVTAIENPDAALPPMLHGFRSATRIIDLPRDGSVGGPMLVILPYRATPTLAESSPSFTMMTLHSSPSPTLHAAPTKVAP